ncbi:MAG: signal peptidase I [Firmicutes bacterium]|nr:signal peptidase I [Bacillota bacterium]
METDRNLSEQELSFRKRRKKREQKRPSLAVGLITLIIKLLIVAIIVFILLNYVFGVKRNLSLNMQPAIQDGDLLFYYRLVDDYTAGDVVVVHYEKKTVVSRIAAVAGDTVDITEEGLIINGSRVQEPGIVGRTTQFEGGVTFPLTVPPGQAFVLGDNREHATDSRIFGCIAVQDINGRVVGMFRRRNI